LGTHFYRHLRLTICFAPTYPSIFRIEAQCFAIRFAVRFRMI
jgi:hypothetical protein